MAAEDLGIEHAAVGYNLLTSRDHIIKRMAWVELQETGNYRYQITIPQNKEDFLNSIVIDGERNANAYKSQWTLARAASKKLNIK